MNRRAAEPISAGRPRAGSDASPPPREIYQSGSGLLMALLFAGLFGAGSVLQIVQGSMPAQLAWGALALMCVWVAVSVGGRALTASVPVLVVNEAGISDRRFMAAPLRWSTVDMVTPLKGSLGTTGALLHIRPDARDEVKVSAFAAALHLCPALGRKTVGISGLGLAIGGEDLYQLCLSYSRLHTFEVEPLNV